MSRLARVARSVVVTFAFGIVAGCGAPPGGSPDVPPVDPEGLLTSAVTEFLSSGDASATTDLDQALGAVFAAHDDVVDGLDDSLATILENVRTADDYLALITQSIALNGYAVEAMTTPGDDSATETAAGRPAVCGDGSPTVVLFINGINNTWPEFRSSVFALGMLLSHNRKPLKIDGYYNVSGKDREHALLGGYVCPFGCAFGAMFTILPRFLSPRLDAAYDAFCQFACDAAGVGADLAQAGEQAFNEYLSIAPDPLDAKRFRDRIQEYVDDSYTVIVVAHSQGNFMAQQALGDLTEPDGDFPAPAESVGVISVGSPTTEPFAVATANQLTVMVQGEAMSRLPFTPTGNVPDQIAEGQTGISAAIARHGFNESYLRNTFAQQMIKDAVSRMSCDLTNPRKKVQLFGTVLSRDEGQPLAGAILTVTIGDTKETMTTGADGSYSGVTINAFEEKGSFSMIVSKPGFTDIVEAFLLTEDEVNTAKRQRTYEMAVDNTYVPGELIVTPVATPITGRVGQPLTATVTISGGYPPYTVSFYWDDGGWDEMRREMTFAYGSTVADVTSTATGTYVYNTVSTAHMLKVVVHDQNPCHDAAPYCDDREFNFMVTITE